MSQKIFLGDAIIKNIKKDSARKIYDVVYTESCTPNDEYTRNRVLKSIRPSERQHYQITKLCFDSAKQIGESII